MPALHPSNGETASSSGGANGSPLRSLSHRTRCAWSPGGTAPSEPVKVTDADVARKIANRLKVSTRATSLRLQELGLAPSSLYGAVESLFASLDWNDGGGGGGGQPAPEKRFHGVLGTASPPAVRCWVEGGDSLASIAVELGLEEADRESANVALVMDRWGVGRHRGSVAKFDQWEANVAHPLRVWCDLHDEPRGGDFAAQLWRVVSDGW